MHDCRSLMLCFKAAYIGQCLPLVIAHDGTQLKHNANYMPLCGLDGLPSYNFALCLNCVRPAVGALRTGRPATRAVERLTDVECSSELLGKTKSRMGKAEESF